MMQIRLKKIKGFSLAEALISMIVIAVILAVIFPMITAKKKVENRDLSSSGCVVEQNGNITSDACVWAIKKCKYDQSNACNNLKYFADLGSAAQIDAAKNVLKEACDQGSNDACGYFLNQCKDNVDDCDISGKDYDLNYYLNLPSDSNNQGKLVLIDDAGSYYSSGFANITNQVNNLCCNPELNFACAVKGVESCS